VSSHIPRFRIAPLIVFVSLTSTIVSTNAWADNSHGRAVTTVSISDALKVESSAILENNSMMAAVTLSLALSALGCMFLVFGAVLRKRFSADDTSYASWASSEVGQSRIRKSLTLDLPGSLSAYTAARFHSGSSRLARLVQALRGELHLTGDIAMPSGLTEERRRRRTS
jgi:hypothetical protein